MSLAGEILHPSQVHLPKSPGRRSASRPQDRLQLIQHHWMELHFTTELHAPIENHIDITPQRDHAVGSKIVPNTILVEMPPPASPPGRLLGADGIMATEP